MIMKKTAGLILIIVAAYSCAVENSNIMDGVAESTFKSWVARNAPMAKELPSGIFIEYFRRGNTTDTVVAYQSWLYVNYTVKTLQGNIIATRDSTLARQLGIWKINTHFCDDFVVFKDYDMKLSLGMQLGLMDMKAGDSARIYIPTRLAFTEGSTMNAGQGYTNSGVTYSGSPICFDVRLDHIVDKPATFERDSVQRWMVAKWNKSLKDSVADGMYMNKVVENPAGEEVKDGESVMINYSEFFTDGFILNTTVAEVAKKYGIYDYSGKTKYKPSKITLGSSEFSAVFNKVVPKMRRGEEVEVVTVSKWTVNGNNGSEYNVPQILPYQPRYFYIRLLTQEEENSQDNQ